jgi:hypothetical protein
MKGSKLALVIKRLEPIWIIKAVRSAETETSHQPTVKPLLAELLHWFRLLHQFRELYSFHGLPFPPLNVPGVPVKDLYLLGQPMHFLWLTT